jgi:hypothetical protein
VANYWDYLRSNTLPVPPGPPPAVPPGTAINPGAIGAGPGSQSAGSPYFTNFPLNSGRLVSANRGPAYPPPNLQYPVDPSLIARQNMPPRIPQGPGGYGFGAAPQQGPPIPTPAQLINAQGSPAAPPYAWPGQLPPDQLPVGAAGVPNVPPSASAPPAGPSAAPAPIEPYTLRGPAAAATPPGSPSATPRPPGAPTAAPAAPPAAVAGIPPSAAAQVPNLGYYRPTSGNARGQTWMPYAANDPRMFPGPLAAGGMGAPAPIPANATAQVPPAAPNPNNPYWGPNTAGRAAWGGPIMPQDITNIPVAGVNAPMPKTGWPAPPAAGQPYSWPQTYPS